MIDYQSGGHCAPDGADSHRILPDAINIQLSLELYFDSSDAYADTDQNEFHICMAYHERSSSYFQFAGDSMENHRLALLILVQFKPDAS